MTLVSSYLPVETVANELGVDKLAVLRLVAREKLRAVRAGEGKPWRVHVQELDRYIGSGYLDLAGPHRDENRSFTNPDTYTAEAFSTALIEAARKDIPAALELQKYFRDGVADSVTLAFPQTPGVQKVLKAPFPASGFAPNTPSATRQYPSWKFGFLVNAAQESAERILRAKPTLAPILDRLYESPESFKAILDLVTADFNRRSIAFSVPLAVTRASMTPRPVTVFFTMPYKSLGASFSEVFRLAF